MSDAREPRPARAKTERKTTWSIFYIICRKKIYGGSRKLLNGNNKVRDEGSEKQPVIENICATSGNIVTGRDKVDMP